MTLIDTMPPAAPPVHERVREQHRGRDMGRACPPGAGPARPRPGGAALRYRGTGVLMSQTSHRPRPITPITTIALALLAAAITMWLGLVAHFGATAAGPAEAIPEQLGVVRVQAGESLQHLAARVAPDSPAGQVADRIRELNSLESVALDAGQTLIAPIG